MNSAKDTKTVECMSCGNILTNSEKLCKYCGSSNPNYARSTSQVQTIASLLGIGHERENSNTNPYSSNVPPRPQGNLDIYILLLCFYIFPFILYFIYIKYQENQWDEKYYKTRLGEFYKQNPRPRLSIILLILASFFFIFPGIIYYHSYNKQNELWNLARSKYIV
jgi:hypothetical protein